MKPLSSTLFPCPFCRSQRVRQTGGGRHFAHYRCDECAEIWTAQTSLAAHTRRIQALADETDAPCSTDKVSLH